MSLMDILKGPRCDMCGKRKSDVCKRARLGGTLCGDCAKAYRMGGGSTNRNVNRKRK